MARALLANGWVRRKHRKSEVHSVSEPDSAGRERQACEIARRPILSQSRQVIEGGISGRDLFSNWGSLASIPESSGAVIARGNSRIALV
ncbi:hypothetical protein [Endozoicomonas sp. ALB115]|uniref:hypothetical protein n=1 Tax=Endozoicomonas sp. ALB115 TaxID=3403074 RepID=UPI003BB80C43